MRPTPRCSICRRALGPTNPLYVLQELPASARRAAPAVIVACLDCIEEGDLVGDTEELPPRSSEGEALFVYPVPEDYNRGRVWPIVSLPRGQLPPPEQVKDWLTT